VLWVKHRPGLGQGTFLASMSRPGQDQGTFLASAPRPGLGQGTFLTSMSRPGPGQGTFLASMSRPGQDQGTFLASMSRPGPGQGTFLASAPQIGPDQGTFLASAPRLRFPQFPPTTFRSPTLAKCKLTVRENKSCPTRRLFVHLVLVQLPHHMAELRHDQARHRETDSAGRAWHREDGGRSDRAGDGAGQNGG